VRVVGVAAGSRLRDAQGRASVTVVKVKHYHGHRQMRDLTVADTHTYYVLAGNTPVLVHNTTECETYYRTMTDQHFAELEATGRMPAGSETFISPTQEFSEAYDGALIRFSVRQGTTEQLTTIGVRDTSRLAMARFPDMPPASPGGWMRAHAYFKTEGKQINIGLGQGTALDIFNDAIMAFERIPR
jgi:hypothetical protein